MPKSEVRYNSDATLRLVLTGKVIWLRPPTVGELEDLTLARNVVAEQVMDFQAQIDEINKATLEWSEEASKAIKADEKVPDQPPNRNGEANALTMQQRRVWAAFWAEKIIPLLAIDTNPGFEVKADDLPAFMGAGKTLGSAFEAWNVGPTDPGDV